MKEVVGANEIHSKILFCEFFILVSSVITITLGVIDVILKLYCFKPLVRNELFN